MNENARAKLELLKIMKDLNGQGFRLNNEINTLIKSMFNNFNVTKEDSSQSEKNDTVEKFNVHISKDKKVNGKVVIVNKSHRGIGKTTSLINASLKYDIPIVVKTKAESEYISFLCKKENIEKQPSVYTLSNIYGTVCFNGVLVDETIALEDYKRISPNIIRGGYYYSNELFV